MKQNTKAIKFKNENTKCEKVDAIQYCRYFGFLENTYVFQYQSIILRIAHVPFFALLRVHIQYLYIRVHTVRWPRVARVARCTFSTFLGIKNTICGIVVVLNLEPMSFYKKQKDPPPMPPLPPPPPRSQVTSHKSQVT